MFLKSLRKNLLAVIATAYSLLVALFWLALRINWSGISKALGGDNAGGSIAADSAQAFFIMETPLIICVFLWLAFAFMFVSLLVWKRKLPSIISLSISGAFTVIIIVVIALGACDYMSFIMPYFICSVLIALTVAIFALLLFFPPVGKGKLQTITKGVCVGLVVLLCLGLGCNLTVNGFSYGAVVYAVEDEYQIVFSTSANSIAWVEIDGENYYDLYAGSMKSNDLVHKVSVPQDKLNSAGGYKIYAQRMIYRGPFGGYKGSIISKEYNFRPVDSSDGLVYYSMSDVHAARKGAVDAAKSVSNLDFLVMLGDNVSMVDSEFDAQFANLLASDITGGEIPCIYVRGNHEIKGNYAEELYKYVGAKNDDFYYWFTLKGRSGSEEVYGITLDLGEDHDDDWWEYYGTAQFVKYQEEQTALLQNIVDTKPYENYNYKLVCCHIPVQFINSRGNHVEIKNTWTALLNQFEPDLSVSGHQHDLYPFLEGKIDVNEKGRLIYNPNFKGEGKLYGAKGGVTDFHFNCFIVGRRGLTQTDTVSAVNRTDHVGLVTEVNLTSGTQVSYYINSRYAQTHEKVSVYQPFFNSAAQTEFVTELKTGK